MKKIVITLFTIFLLTCCEKDDKFINLKSPYLGNELRTDGYYYREENNEYMGFRCLYRDGCLLTMSGKRSSLELADSHIEQNFLHNSSYKEKKLYWGLFLIQNNNQLRMEYYRGSNWGWEVYVEEGIILNDTTFEVNSMYRIDGSDWQNLNHTYHFRQFYPKPDSTNKFKN